MYDKIMSMTNAQTEHERPNKGVSLLLQSTKFMLGIIIAVICSNWVGEAIHSDGIYETDLEADGSVIFLRPSPPRDLFFKTAGEIAAKAVWCVSPGKLNCKPLTSVPLLARGGRNEDCLLCLARLACHRSHHLLPHVMSTQSSIGRQSIELRQSVMLWQAFPFTTDLQCVRFICLLEGQWNMLCK